MQNQSNHLPQKVIHGIELFNQHKFYEAHEYFEAAWRATSNDSREFFRVLLQISGGLYRLAQDRPAAAQKFLSRARFWLEAFLPSHCGFDTANLNAYLGDLLNAIKEGVDAETILALHFIPLPLPDQKEN